MRSGGGSLLFSNYLEQTNHQLQDLRQPGAGAGEGAGKGEGQEEGDATACCLSKVGFCSCVFFVLWVIGHAASFRQ